MRRGARGRPGLLVYSSFACGSHAFAEDGTMKHLVTFALLNALLSAPVMSLAQHEVPMVPGHDGMIRVLLLDGQSAGAYHNWKIATQVMKAELEETGLFQVTVMTAPASD